MMDIIQNDVARPSAKLRSTPPWPQLPIRLSSFPPPAPRSAGSWGSFVVQRPQARFPCDRAAVERAKLSPDRIDEVFMGCVLPAGQGQAPARQAARGAKLPDATGQPPSTRSAGPA